MNSFNNSGIAILLIFFILIAGIGILKFFGFNLDFLTFLKEGAYNILSPLVEAVHNIGDSITDYFYCFRDTNELVAKNERLKEKIGELKLDIIELQKYKRENERLRDILAFKKLVSFETEGVEVIGYGPSNWEKKILIAKGKKDGIEEGMPVITYNGTFVGQVDYSGETTSQVKLISDPNFAVAGIVQREESRAVGLVKGRVQNDKFSIMEDISWEADVKEGDLILTSGLSNTFPKGLPIGKVISVESANYGVSQKAKIDLFMDLKTIEEVLVITDF